MRRRTFIAGIAAGTAPLVAGCTDGGGEPAANPTESATRTSTSTATETPTATESMAAESAQAAYPDFNWERLEGVDPVGTDAVTLRNVEFDPTVAAVEPGTAVTFTNEDAAGHTVTIPAVDVDRQLDSGESTTVTFGETGTYDYVCTIHPPDMLGRVVVTEDSPGAQATATATATETPTETDTPTATETETQDDGGGYY